MQKTLCTWAAATSVAMPASDAPATQRGHSSRSNPRKAQSQQHCCCLYRGLMKRGEMRVKQLSMLAAAVDNDGKMIVSATFVKMQRTRASKVTIC
jgi:hypothetical protein